MRLAGFRILILSCIISAVTLTHVGRTRHIFGKCIDKKLSAILTIITLAEDQKGRTDPMSAIEINERVDSIMRMIKEYLVEEQSISENVGRRSRKFFFWPFRPWSFRLPFSVQAGVQGGLYGGIGPSGFHLGGGLNGGLEGRWSHYR